MSRIWNFFERLNFSEGIETQTMIMEFILSNIPSALRVEKANISGDKSGTDWWIHRKNLPPLSVDLKNRELDPIEKYNSDDACIETTSIYTGPKNDNFAWEDKFRKKIGWTLDDSKRTDLIVYTWPTCFNINERRFWCLWFPYLCMASKRNWRNWAKLFHERAAENRDYLTLSVYPPRTIIAHAMRELMSGTMQLKIAEEKRI